MSDRIAKRCCDIFPLTTFDAATVESVGVNKLTKKDDIADI